MSQERAKLPQYVVCVSRPCVSPARTASHCDFSSTEITHGVCQPDRLLLCLSPGVTGVTFFHQWSSQLLSALQSYYLLLNIIKPENSAPNVNISIFSYAVLIFFSFKCNINISLRKLWGAVCFFRYREIMFTLLNHTVEREREKKKANPNIWCCLHCQGFWRSVISGLQIRPCLLPDNHVSPCDF